MPKGYLKSHSRLTLHSAFSSNDRPNHLRFLGLTYFREYPTVYIRYYSDITKDFP